MRFIFAFMIVCSSLLALQPFKDFMPEPRIPYNPLHYVCYRTMGEVTIDGKLDEQSWQNAAWSEAFVDIEGDAKPKPQWTTRMKMMWDDEFLYFGAYLEEPDLWGTITMRDAVIFRDNDFEIFIDPDGDTHQYYEFEMNALNTVWDLLLVKPYRDGRHVALDYWDIRDMKTAVNLEGTLNNALDTDKGWSVEVAMPWHVLSECADIIPPRPGDKWRVNFSRVQWDRIKIGKDYQKARRPEHNWVWSPQGIVNMHYPEMWGIVQFSDFTVENQIAEFFPDFKDQAKWMLRQIYYKEHTYFMQHGKYTDSWEKLGLSLIVPPEFEKPKIFVTPNGFEAFTLSNDGYYKVLITTDGACNVTWLKNKKKAGL